MDFLRCARSHIHISVLPVIFWRFYDTLHVVLLLPFLNVDQLRRIHTLIITPIIHNLDISNSLAAFVLLGDRVARRDPGLSNVMLFLLILLFHVFYFKKFR